ncbi:MAG: AAA family ATPase [Planctomycetota bacterium]
MTTSLSGTVASIRFSNERFTIGTIAIPGWQSHPTFTCPAALVRHQDVTLHGAWSVHPRYGRQFTAETMTVDLPINAAGLARFLTINPAAKGIGPVKGRQIAETYGADFEDALLQRPEEIAHRFGLRLDAVQNLRTAWLASRIANAVATELAAYGLTYHQITTIAEALGPNAVALLQEDPYRLVGALDGLGFHRVDQVAQRMGIPKRHAGRIRAGLIHLVREGVRDGHCWVSEGDLVREGITLLALDDLDAGACIRQQLEALVVCAELCRHEIDGAATYGLPHLAQWEAATVEWLLEARVASPPEVPETTVLSQLPDSLNQDQILAALHAFTERASVITGGAGVGKTFTVAAIVGVARQLGWSVELAAPTGKAAQRMAEQVAQHGEAIEAKTIHRLLRYHPVLGWQVNREQPLEAELLIVDECSMIDAELAYRLACGIDPQCTSVVFVGDPNQLPPVGAGAFLRDILATGALSTCALTRVMRQAGVLRERSLGILDGRLEATARDGDDIAVERRTTWHVLPQFNDPVSIPAAIEQLWQDILPNRFGVSGDRLLQDVQILTPTHKGPLGTAALNRRIQELVHGRDRLAEAQHLRTYRGCGPLLAGDKIVWLRNDYELDLFNGQVGIIDTVGSQADEDGRQQPALHCTFDGRQVTVPREKWNRLQLAYAMTVHKAQGSEWPCVIVICHKAHSFQHHRGWLYTGATRASRCCMVLGDRWGMRSCAEKERSDQRRSYLVTWLRQPLEAV